MEIEVRKATLDDVDALVDIRREFQLEAKGTRGDEAFAQAVRVYLERALPREEAVAMVAQAAGGIAACAVLSCVTDLPTIANPSGRRGCLHNVYTRPAFRRRGLGRQVVQACISWAKQAGLGSISLGATEQGRPLYEKLGFQLLSNEMELDIQ